MLEDDYYEPTDEELAEIEEIIRQEEEKEWGASPKFGKFIKREEEPKTKNRLLYEFKSESHWSGWLKIHGITW